MLLATTIEYFAEPGQSPSDALGIIPLLGATVGLPEEVGKTNKKDGTFLFHLSTPTRTYMLRTSAASDRTEWIRTLKVTIGKVCPGGVSCGGAAVGSAGWAAD